MTLIVALNYHTIGLTIFLFDDGRQSKICPVNHNALVFNLNNFMDDWQ